MSVQRYYHYTLDSNDSEGRGKKKGLNSIGFGLGEAKGPKNSEEDGNGPEDEEGEFPERHLHEREEETDEENREDIRKSAQSQPHRPLFAPQQLCAREIFEYFSSKTVLWRNSKPCDVFPEPFLE